MIPTITIDVGTTSVKLCLFDADSALVTTSRHPTPTTTDEAGTIYDVAALLGQVRLFIAGLPPAERARVRRIAVTGVGESGGLVRPDLTLASPMILWHDQRGLGSLARLSPEERRLVYRVTGLPVSGNYGLSKAVWAMERLEGPAVDVRWLNIAEYLAAVMTGQRWSEPSLASRTMALDLTTGTWSAEVCELVGLDVRVFPGLRPAVEGCAITSAYAAEVGLEAEVHVHVAGHDHMVGAVGAALRPGELLNSTGTTEGLLYLRDAPRLDEQAQHDKLANGLSCSGSDHTLFASIPTGGSAYATLQLMMGLGPDRLDACLADLHARYLAGAIDLDAVPLVLPHFRGSPPPTKNPAARGAVAGLGADTGLEDLVLGCFLGMAWQFCEVLELFGVLTKRVKVIGPASRNRLWLQLKADLLGVPLEAARFPEVVSRGAQALASGVPAAWDSMQPRDIEADPGRHARLTRWRADNRAQWARLQDLSS